MAKKIYGSKIKTEITARDFKKEVGKVKLKSGEYLGGSLKKYIVNKFRGGKTVSSVSKQLIRREGLAGSQEKQNKRLKLIKLISGSEKGEKTVRPGVKIIEEGITQEKKKVILSPAERSRDLSGIEKIGRGRVDYAGGYITTKERLNAGSREKGTMGGLGITPGEYGVSALSKEKMSPITESQNKDLSKINPLVKFGGTDKTIGIGGINKK